MQVRMRSLFKLILWVLYFQGSLAEDPFKKEGDGVKFDESFQAEKTTLFVKSERLEVEFKGGSVSSDLHLRPNLDFGGCKISVVNLDMSTTGSKSLAINGKALNLPVLATITKDRVKFAEAESVDRSKSITCQPVFRLVKGGYAIDVGNDLGKSVKEFSATYKNAMIYDASSEDSLGPLWIVLIVASGILIFALSFGSSGFGLFKFIKHLRLAQVEQPIAQPPVKPIVKQDAKPEAKSKVKTVDEVEDEKPEAPPKKTKPEEMPEKDRKESKPAKRSIPEETTDLQTKSEDVVIMKRLAGFRLKTAEFRLTIPFNAKLAEKAAIDDPETEAKWRAARLTANEADVPYEVPEFVSKHYLKPTLFPC